MRKSVCFAYFGDGTFLGWYADTAGSVRPNSPKVYGYTDDQLAVLERNFHSKLSRLNEKSELAEKTGQPGLKLLDDSLNADKENLSRYKAVELRAVECPFYDGPNPNFDEVAHKKLVDEWSAKWKKREEELKLPEGVSLERFNAVKEFEKENPFPRANNWVYCDYSKVSEWAKNEPTQFLKTFTYKSEKA